MYESVRSAGSTVASARCAVRRSPMPSRTPPARIDATSAASRAVTTGPLDIGEHPRIAHAFDVLAHLQRGADRVLERRGVEGHARERPVDRLAGAGQLVGVLCAPW